MNPTVQQPAYPAWAFPRIIRSAIENVGAATKAPPALVGGSALTATALPVQNLADVCRFDGLTSGCSLSTITISDSGERKTTVDNLFTSAILEYQAEQDSAYHKELAEFKNAEEIWRIKHRSITKQIERAFSNGESTDQIEEVLASHDKSRPDRPRRTKLIYNDATPAAFIHGLHVNSKSAGIFDDEAARIFCGPLVDDLGLLNKAWNGSDIHVDRRTSECFTVKDVRVTSSFMIQEPVFCRYMERKGDQARGIGYLARCLVSRPESTMGTRFINGYPSNLEFLAEFHRRVRDLLEQASTDENGITRERTVLHFSPDAQTEWVSIYNQIENNINPGGVFCESKDYASKVAENIARVAAVFHVFEGYGSNLISLETLRSATTVVLWYAQEFIRLFAPPDPLHETIKDATLLDQWISKLYAARNWCAIQKSFVLQRGPNSLRSKDRLDWALNCLWRAGRVRPAQEGRKELIVINTDYYAPMSQGQVPIGFPPLTI